MKKYLLYISLIFSISAPATADWHGDYEVIQLVLEGTDNQPIVNFSLSPNPTRAETGCTDNTFVTMQTSSEMGKQALSLLITASAAGKKIKVYLDNCLGVRPNVKHIWLIN